MDGDTRRIVGVLAAVVVLVAAVVLWWRAQQAGLPQLVEVRVAARAEGEDMASDRHRVFPPGSRVLVGAVVGYRRSDGTLHWVSPFSEVESRGERLPVHGLDRWPRAAGTLRANWYTVEPSLLGWIGVSAEDAHYRLEYEDFLDTEMGRDLLAEVRWHSNNAEFLSTPPAGHQVPGGTMRFRVRVGTYKDPRDLFARDSVISPGAAEVWRGSVPAVTRDAELPPGLHPATSSAFRLGCFSLAPGIWPDGGPDWPLPLTPAEMAEHFLITTPRSLAALAGSGDPTADPWSAPEAVVLRGGAWHRRGAAQALRWGRDVAAGDAMHVGERYLVLVRDDGDGLVSLGDEVLFGWMEPPRFRALGLAMPADAASGHVLRVAR